MSLRAIIAMSLIGLATLFASVTVHAQDAYTVEVAVADRSPGEQSAAYRIAMQRVLLDNSPDKTLLNRSDVRDALASAKTYVVQFSYRAPNSGEVIAATTPVTDLVRATGEATQIMKVRFDRERIGQIIKGTPQSSAEEVSPVQFNNALVWLLIRDNSRDLLIGGASGAKVMERSREIAGGNGVVLSFPAADASDLEKLGGSDLVLTQDNVLNASIRYTAPVIVSADVSRKQPVGWKGEWRRIANGQVANQSFEASSLDEMLQLGLAWMSPQGGTRSSNAVATALSTPSAPLASESTIWFSGVQTTESYAQVMKMIGGTEGVESVYAKELREQGLLIAIQPRSALAQVRARLSSVGTFRETARPVFPDGSSPALDLAFDVLR